MTNDENGRQKSKLVDSGKNLPGILEKTCRGFWKKPAGDSGKNLPLFESILNLI